MTNGENTDENRSGWRGDAQTVAEVAPERAIADGPGARGGGGPDDLQRRHRRSLAFITLIGAFAGLLFGYDTGVISGALLYLGTDKGFHPGGLSAAQQGFVTSIMLIGAALTAFYGGGLADRWGRRRLLQVGDVLFLLGALGSAVAPDLTALLVARLVLGLGLGITSTIVPVYLSEIAPTRVRGRLMSTNAVMVSAGQLLAMTINAIIGFTGSWRLMLVLAAAPAVALGIGLLFITETPNWCVLNGRVREARDVLLRTRDAEDAQLELYELEESAKAQKGRKAKTSDFFKAKWLRRTLLIGICIALINQLSGINTVIYFAPSLFRTIGFGEQASLNVDIAIGLVSLLAAIAVGFGLIDRFPRRLLLGIGTAGVAVTMAAMGISYGFIRPGGSATPTWVFLGIMLVYLVLNQGFIAATTWTAIAEVFPGRLRGQGTGIATLSLWLANFGISTAFLPTLSTVGGRATFLGFATINVAAFLFVLLVMPETRGKSLVEIESEARARTGE